MQVSTSSRGACGITLDQEVKCWGSPTHMHPHQMEGQFTQISGGDNVICGLRVNGAITCFYGGSVCVCAWCMSGYSGQATCQLLLVIDVFCSCAGKWKSFEIQNAEGGNFVQVSCGLNYCCALNNEGEGDIPHRQIRLY